MPTALDLRYRPGGAEDRFAIRDVHLEYMMSVQKRILAGGACMEGCTVVGMYVLLATEDALQIDEFLASEPYTQAGLFNEIRRTVFTAFIPEPSPNFLQGLLLDARPIAQSLRLRGH